MIPEVPTGFTPASHFMGGTCNECGACVLMRQEFDWSNMFEHRHWHEYNRPGFHAFSGPDGGTCSMCDGTREMCAGQWEWEVWKEKDWRTRVSY